MTNAEKLVKGLQDRGVVLTGGWFHIYRDNGQPMMNKAAGEIAPTWYLLRDPMHRHGRITFPGQKPRITWEGQTIEDVEVCSNQSLVWILKHPPKEWEIYWDTLHSELDRRLSIQVGLDPSLKV